MEGYEHVAVSEHVTLNVYALFQYHVSLSLSLSKALFFEAGNSFKTRLSPVYGDVDCSCLPAGVFFVRIPVEEAANAFPQAW